MAWNWPWSKTPQRSRQPTKVSKTRREDKRNGMLHEALVKRLVEDESFTVAYLEKRHGIKVPVVPEKPVEDRIFEEALENDPDLKQRIVEAKARQEELKAGSPLKRQVDEMAAQLLADRPDLLRAAAEKQIAAKLGNATGTDPLEASIALMEQLAALMK